MKTRQRPLPEELPVLEGCSEVLRRVYAARGIRDSEELDMRLQRLLSFDALIDIEKACIRLEQALLLNESILIVGDFDADGATSTALAVSALRAFGCQQVNYLVPNRFEFGYGLTPDIVRVAKSLNPSLIVTVDNGIASFEGVETANELGIDVIVTDHHLPAESLPNALAIVNPNRIGDPFPCKAIAGVGVIFYVMLALRRHLETNHYFEQRNVASPHMAQFLDLVALGTVADVVALDKNNRILVWQGVQRIQKKQCRPGILALIKVAGRDYSRLQASDLGFSVAPRLNAAGRLQDMSLGIECLLAPDEKTAETLARRLDELNSERRAIESDMKEQAMMAISNLSQSLEGTPLPLALCLYDPSFHQGVIGILAGRLKERYHRPVIVFSKTAEDELKGSCRSIQGLNIRDVLAAIERKNPGLIVRFGGHAMAAGLTLLPSHFKRFQEAFVEEVSGMAHLFSDASDFWCDGSLTPSEIHIDVARELEEAGPWGQQFPVPTFFNTFDILEQRLVGARHLKLTLAHTDGGDAIDAIAFNIDLDIWPNHSIRKIKAVYRPGVNVYQGRTRLQLLMDALEPV